MNWEDWTPPPWQFPPWLCCESAVDAVSGTQSQLRWVGWWRCRWVRRVRGRDVVERVVSAKVSALDSTVGCSMTVYQSTQHQRCFASHLKNSAYTYWSVSNADDHILRFILLKYKRKAAGHVYSLWEKLERESVWRQMEGGLSPYLFDLTLEEATVLRVTSTGATQCRPNTYPKYNVRDGQTVSIVIINGQSHTVVSLSSLSAGSTYAGFSLSGKSGNVGEFWFDWNVREFCCLAGNFLWSVSVSICNWQRLNCHVLKYSSCKYWVCLKEVTLALKGDGKGSVWGRWSPPLKW